MTLRRSRTTWLVFAAFLALFLFTARGRVTVIDGLARYQVTQSIVERGSVRLPAGWPHALIGREGQAYSYYSLGQALVGVPFYLAGKAAASGFDIEPVQATRAAYSFINPFMVAGLCAVFFALCIALGYSHRTALLLTATLGLGTILWQQSKDSFEHPQEALCVLSGVLLAYRGVTGERRVALLAAGALFGAALLTRQSALFFFAPTLAYVLVVSARRACATRGLADVLLCMVAALPFLVAMGWYNWVRTGSPFVEAYHATGHFAEFDRLPVRGLVGLLLSPGRGLFEYQPVLILLLTFPSALIAFWRRHRALTALFAVVSLVTVLFYARFRMWDGGLSWGPRYLVPVIPLLLLPLGELIERSRQRARTGLAVLLAIGILIQLSSVLVDHQIWFHEVAVRNARGEHIAINSDPRNSPIIRQWGSLAKVVMPARFGAFQGIAPEEKTDPPFATPDDYARGIDFWWLRGPLPPSVRYPAAIVLALLVLALSAALVAATPQAPHH